MNHAGSARILSLTIMVSAVVLRVQENFEDVCVYQSSGISHILVLTKGNFGETIIEEWLEVLGPPNVAEAQEAAATRYVHLYYVHVRKVLVYFQL